MIPWWAISILCGSFALAFLWAFERTRDFNILLWLVVATPLALIIELFYWYGFRHAPSFLFARYFMSATTHALGLVVAFVVLGEKVDPRQLIGLGLMILGVLVMKGG